jgi:branched-chain amino acid transport system substrate-binding protein
MTSKLALATPGLSRRAFLLSAVPAFLAYRSGRAAEPVRIGVSLGLSGRYERLAAMQKRAYLLWERHINETGGLLGRPVEMVIEDDESTADKAVALYRKLINDDRVDLLFGPYSSGITAAVAPVTDEAGYPLLATGAASDAIWQQGYRYVFGVFTSASRYTVGLLNLALLHDLFSVAIVHADDAFSTSAAEGARKWAPRLGLNVVMFEEFEKDRSDLTDLAERARYAGADLLMMVGHFNESINMRRALGKIDWYPRAYFATVGPVFARYRDELGEAADLTFSTSLWEPGLRFPQSREFEASFRALYQLEPTYHTAEAYAGGQILEAAVKAVGGFGREDIRQALQDLQMHTIIGRYGVDHTGMQVKHFALTIQWQEGKKEIVWPEEIATATPRFGQ